MFYDERFTGILLYRFAHRRICNAHRGHPGYCPIDISLAGAPNIRELADKLNYQFGVTKEQEADMLAEALSEQNAPAKAIIEQQEFTL